ncbi:hypothetical protein [Delftia phage PhiW-14]|uniref:Uncharacterized protein n=1 Tax=Delftia phage PhiW-14 TaxID=665032 RepID=C9DG47_BPW14|nr:hypothetical protein DP-phiW-14_gp076 [Delftia phage PhiW-14]ACV50098.1 hypothetical protein [Delftia phage PhiW-14]
MTHPDPSSSADKAGNYIVGGLASAGAFNAVFGRDKERSWKALGLVALVAGVFYSLWVYILSLKAASKYKGSDFVKVALIPVSLYWVWFYFTGIQIKLADTWNTSPAGHWMAFILICNLLIYWMAGRACWSILGNIHRKYGNGQVAFWKHALCSVSILFLSFGFWGNKAIYMPHSTFWGTTTQRDEYDAYHLTGKAQEAAQQRVDKRKAQRADALEAKLMKDPVYVAKKQAKADLEAKRKAHREEQAALAKQLADKYEAERQAEATARMKAIEDQQAREQAMIARMRTDDEQRAERQAREREAQMEYNSMRREQLEREDRLRSLMNQR